MKLRPCEFKEIGRWYKKTKNQELIGEFAESEHSYVEVVDYPHKTVKSAQNCLNASIRHYGFAGIKCVIRGDKVYLVKDE